MIFSLSDDFISQYVDRPVPWGFTDGGGNSLGEITFMRTYSRLKEDGSKERWHEVCRRVVEGMYSVQKEHCRENRLPWNENQARHSAMEAYERLFTLKWTPPGRGLWMMGTPIVMENRNSAPLQNCFTPDTRFITRDGIRTLGDACGEEMEVWADGDWQKAQIRSFGRQQVQRITFAPFNRRSNIRVVETATPHHRWLLKNGNETTNLSTGDVVWGSSVTSEFIYDEGFRHGLIFGDGSINYTYNNGDFSHMMRLCGDKSKYAAIFTNVHYQPNCAGDPVIYHRSGTNMKSLPSELSGAQYIHSFIDGWAATDGTETSSGCQISTQNREAAEWLIQHAAIGGYLVTGHHVQNNETNFGPRSAPLHRITLSQEKGYWTVKEIDMLPEEEEVYCAVVQNVPFFTLASGIFTGNCAFISTGDMSKRDPAAPFCFLMEALMLGVGVGFDTLGANKDFIINQPFIKPAVEYTIPDTREGWFESVKLLIESYLIPNRTVVMFDYSLIRPRGAPIRTLGGVASGPDPLIELHDSLINIFEYRDGQRLTTADIVDISNLIGKCVVAGNVRRSAEIAIGLPDDKDFLNLKNYEANPYRQGWGWLSNNSINASVGMDYAPYLDAIASNGEPGFVWMDVSRQYGRLADPPNDRDYRAKGYNPCGEQTLESYECCTLVETFINRHKDLADWKRTLKFAYLYAKTVTLIPTHWPQTNAIMQRNRRIGCSVSGLAAFVDNKGWSALNKWLNDGYAEVQGWDEIYSEWLGIRESIKTTSVKPSGTVSLLAGETPGVHWPIGGEYILRAVRFSSIDPLLDILRGAGYRVEPAVGAENTTSVAYFPIRGVPVRPEKTVSVFEKVNLAATVQRHWADNSVSATISFDRERESQFLPGLLAMHEGQLKTISFLPQGNGIYPQMPYTELTEKEWEDASRGLTRMDLSWFYDGRESPDAIGEAYCTNDKCEIPQREG